jgi:hypothetical protein
MYSTYCAKCREFDVISLINGDFKHYPSLAVLKSSAEDQNCPLCNLIWASLTRRDIYSQIEKALDNPRSQIKIYGRSVQDTRDPQAKKGGFYSVFVSSKIDTKPPSVVSGELALFLGRGVLCSYFLKTLYLLLYSKPV